MKRSNGGLPGSAGAHARLRRAIVVLLAAGVVSATVVAAGFASGSGQSAQDPSLKGKIPSLEGKTIAYIQTGSVEYFQRSMEGARAAVQALGGTLLVYNSNYEAATELANVRTAITRGVDGILLFSISRATLTTSARLAKQAGIPVANYYGYVPGTPKDLVGFWTGANAFDIGTLDGKAMAALLKKGDKVAAVQGQLGRGEVEDYQRGFENQVKKKGIVVVAKPTSHWSRQEALARAQELLVKYPDLKGMYCHNDDTTVGCVQALRQRGKKPGELKLVTLNGSPTGIDLIKQGWLQADVTQPPPLESALAVRALAQIIGGEKVKYPVPCYTPISLMTKGNLSNLPLVTTWIPTKASTLASLLTPCANQKKIR
jgi:ABC-type sugar transport system substrate-binding protein